MVSSAWLLNQLKKIIPENVIFAQKSVWGSLLICLVYVYFGLVWFFVGLGFFPWFSCLGFFCVVAYFWLAGCFSLRKSQSTGMYRNS